MTIRFNNTEPQTASVPTVKGGRSTFLLDIENTAVNALIAAATKTLDALMAAQTGDSDISAADYERIEIINTDDTGFNYNITHTLANRTSGGEVGRIFEVVLDGTPDAAGVVITCTTAHGDEDVATLDAAKENIKYEWNGYQWVIASGNSFVA